jgi:hypothetical protein
MWNPFKKSNNSANDPQQMGMLQKLAMKKFMSMSDEEKRKISEKMMTTENISKNKDKILETMKMMKASGQISDEQVELAKKQFGL